jgi:nickel/cobalt transporter (NicO) family protein
MLQLFFGSILLSLVHASIPNHWLTVVSIGRAEKWSLRETLFAAFITGFTHIFSTILIGIAIGIIGYTISERYAFIYEKIAPILLIALGLAFVIADRISHHKHQHGIENIKTRNRSKLAILTSLSLTMFLSPCIELEAYYFNAGSAGWIGILMVSAVYLVVTVTGIVLLVYLASKGVNSIRSHFLDQHGRLLSGAILVLLGIITLFIGF